MNLKNFSSKALRICWTLSQFSRTTTSSTSTQSSLSYSSKLKSFTAFFVDSGFQTKSGTSGYSNIPLLWYVSSKNSSSQEIPKLAYTPQESKGSSPKCSRNSPCMTLLTSLTNSSQFWGLWQFSVAWAWSQNASRISTAMSRSKNPTFTFKPFPGQCSKVTITKKWLM